MKTQFFSALFVSPLFALFMFLLGPLLFCTLPFNVVSWTFPEVSGLGFHVVRRIHSVVMAFGIDVVVWMSNLQTPRPFIVATMDPTLFIRGSTKIYLVDIERLMHPHAPIQFLCFSAQAHFCWHLFEAVRNLEIVC